jgi:hypothetical protein
MAIFGFRIGTGQKRTPGRLRHERPAAQGGNLSRTGEFFPLRHCRLVAPPPERLRDELRLVTEPRNALPISSDHPSQAPRPHRLHSPGLAIGRTFDGRTCRGFACATPFYGGLNAHKHFATDHHPAWTCAVLPRLIERRAREAVCLTKLRDRVRSPRRMGCHPGNFDFAFHGAIRLLMIMRFSFSRRAPDGVGPVCAE